MKLDCINDIKRKREEKSPISLDDSFFLVTPLNDQPINDWQMPDFPNCSFLALLVSCCAFGHNGGQGREKKFEQSLNCHVCLIKLSQPSETFVYNINHSNLFIIDSGIKFLLCIYSKGNL